MRSSSYSVRNVAVDNTPSFEEFAFAFGSSPFLGLVLVGRFPFFMESGFLAPERQQKAGTHTTP